MAGENYLAILKQGVINLDFDAVKKAAQDAMDAGIDPGTVITEGMVPGMAVVGDKFESGEYFLSELVVAGEVMKEGVEIVNPYIKPDVSGKAEKIKAVLASVEGDNHDLGKNIVSTLLGVQGFEVIDLGMDVRSDVIVEAVKKHKPAVLGLSALLTMTMPKMGEVIEALKAAGLRDSVKIIVGGTPVTDEFAESIGADHHAANALEGVNKCTEWVNAKERRN